MGLILPIRGGGSKAIENIVDVYSDVTLSIAPLSIPTLSIAPLTPHKFKAKNTHLTEVSPKNNGLTRSLTRKCHSCSAGTYTQNT